jgi:hypothetical protein
VGTKNKSSGTQLNPRGATQGITLVAHESGLPFDSIVDLHGVRRLAVDANVTIGSAIISVDIQSDTDNIAIRNTADNNELYIESDGTINIRLRDESGAAFTDLNPLPVKIASAVDLNVELSAKDGDTVAVSGHPSQIFPYNSVDIALGGIYTVILTYVAGANDTGIAFAEATGPVEALIRMRLNGVTIRQKRVSASSPNAEFPFFEPRRINIGDTITVEAKLDKNPPGFMVGGATFIASVQGFIE